jgi:transcriptional regulator with XRE-family HTH domain
VGKTYYKDVKAMKAFGAKVRAIRDAKNITQEKLANTCGFAVSHLSKIENGINNASLSHIVKIAQVLKVKPKDLMDF